MLYNIIGDIHGRTKWKDLVVADGINIFVGDYFSPYEGYLFDDLVDNFYEIIKYKDEHPNTILLLGNHDLEYFAVDEKYSRHDSVNADTIRQIFLEELGKFQLAYSVENKVLVTHAGVSIVWYDRYKYNTHSWIVANCDYDDPDEIESPYTHEIFPYENPIKYSLMHTAEEAYNAYMDKNFKTSTGVDNSPRDGNIIKWNHNYWKWDGYKFIKYEVTPNEVADFINNLWFGDKYSAFNFNDNCGPYDYYGDDERHSPVWIRTTALIGCNIFKYSDYKQVFGHTISNDLIGLSLTNGRYNGYSFKLNDENTNNFNLYMVDCLQSISDSLVYDSDHDRFIRRSNLTMTI